MSQTNQSVQLLKMIKGLKFQIFAEVGFIYQCSENKGKITTWFHVADLQFCFHHLFFLNRLSLVQVSIFIKNTLWSYFSEKS